MSEMLLLAPPKKKAPHYVSTLVRVPVGHVLPCGTAVTQAFDVTVQAGARWHPDWPEPRISVMAYRFLSQGDAIGFTGHKVLAFPVTGAARVFAGGHGDRIDKRAEEMLAEFGLSVPTEREPIVAMIVRPASKLN